MKERTRLKPDDRRGHIVKAALKEAEKVGFAQVRRKAVAERARCSEALVTHYVGTVPQLQRLIIGEALREGNQRVIAQGIIAKHPRCRKLTEEEKQKALASI